MDFVITKVLIALILFHFGFDYYLETLDISVYIRYKFKYVVKKKFVLPLRNELAPSTSGSRVVEEFNVTSQELQFDAFKFCHSLEFLSHNLKGLAPCLERAGDQ